VEWLLVLGVCVVLAAVTLSVAAVMAAAASDREPAADGERAATWEAGYTDHDLYALAALAATARIKLDAGRVEVVLEHAGGTGDGVVVTGSRLPAGRLGDRVAPGEGLAGRGLLARRPLVAEPRPGERPGEMAVPIRSHDGVVGVVTVTAAEPGRRFTPRHAAWLEALAADAGDRLGPRAGEENRGTG
jgi:GAF domain-containing protein